MRQKEVVAEAKRIVKGEDEVGEEGGGGGGAVKRSM